MIEKAGMLLSYVLEKAYGVKFSVASLLFARIFINFEKLTFENLERMTEINVPLKVYTPILYPSLNNADICLFNHGALQRPRSFSSGMSINKV